jgi:hypothetical protein
MTPVFLDTTPCLVEKGYQNLGESPVSTVRIVQEDREKTTTGASA